MQRAGQADVHLDHVAGVERPGRGGTRAPPWAWPSWPSRRPARPRGAGRRCPRPARTGRPRRGAGHGAALSASIQAGIGRVEVAVEAHPEQGVDDQIGLRAAARATRSGSDHASSVSAASSAEPAGLPGRVALARAAGGCTAAPGGPGPRTPGSGPRRSRRRRCCPGPQSTTMRSPGAARAVARDATPRRRVLHEDQGGDAAALQRLGVQARARRRRARVGATGRRAATRGEDEESRVASPSPGCGLIRPARVLLYSALRWFRCAKATGRPAGRGSPSRHPFFASSWRSARGSRGFPGAGHTRSCGTPDTPPRRWPGRSPTGASRARIFPAAVVGKRWVRPPGRVTSRPSRLTHCARATLYDIRDDLETWGGGSLLTARNPYLRVPSGNAGVLDS